MWVSTPMLQSRISAMRCRIQPTFPVTFGRSPDASVNVVLCTETLEHVLETRSFLAEAARCLVPGGTLLLTVPFAARWHFIPYDYWRFTPSSLNHLLTTTGFNRRSRLCAGNALTVACYKVMTLIATALDAAKYFGKF